MPQCTHIKIAGTWTDVRRTYIKVGGTWERVTKAYEKLQGTWHQFCHLPAHAVLPVFTGAIADIEAVVGEAFTQDISPNYATGDRVNTYTLENAPTGMAISNAGLISWPSPTKVTASGILVKAINAGGETVSNAFGATAIALGPEIVLNGDFSDGLNHWAPSSGSPAVIDNGECKIHGAGFRMIQSNIATVAGKTYQWGFHVRGNGLGDINKIIATIEIRSTGNVQHHAYIGDDKTFNGTLTATGLTRLDLTTRAGADPGTTVWIDNVGIREVLP